MKSQECREVFSLDFEEYVTSLPQKAILTEEVPELGNILPFKSVVKQEFYMPKYLHKLDPDLNQNYWQIYEKVISHFQGILISSVK